MSPTYADLDFFAQRVTTAEKSHITSGRIRMVDTLFNIRVILKNIEICGRSEIGIFVRKGAFHGEWQGAVKQFIDEVRSTMILFIK